MTGDNAIRRVDLLRLLESESSVGQAQPIVEQLRAVDADELPMSALPTHQLQAIYERRRTRMPDAHPLSASVDRLLAALQNYRDPVVIAITLESSTSIAVVWLSAAADSVISTLVESRDV